MFDALRKIVADEGLRALWTGGVITMCRAVSMNCCQLVSYAETKERLTAYLGPETS